VGRPSTPLTTLAVTVQHNTGTELIVAGDQTVVRFSLIWFGWAVIDGGAVAAGAVMVPV
jgi:hypothetical protein